MRTLAIAFAAAAASAALWYVVLAVALDVAAWIAIALGAASALLTFFAVARDAART